jgi:hypothetical protein
MERLDKGHLHLRGGRRALKQRAIRTAYKFTIRNLFTIISRFSEVNARNLVLSGHKIIRVDLKGQCERLYYSITLQEGGIVGYLI